MSEKFRSFGRQDDAFFAALQQDDAELVLQIVEDLAQMRLGDVQFLRGPVDRADFRDGDEVFQMLCVHLALLRLSVIQITLIAITNNFTFILPC